MAHVSAQQESHEGSAVRSPQQYEDDPQRRRPERADGADPAVPPGDAAPGGPAPGRVRSAPPQQPHLYAEICIPTRRTPGWSGGEDGNDGGGGGGGGDADDELGSLAATTISALTGRSSMFAPEYAASAWCHGGEERGAPSPEIAADGPDGRPAGEGAGEDYFDYSPDERDGHGVGARLDGRARTSASRPGADGEGLATRLGGCFGGWEAVRAVTCRCFDFGTDEALFGDAAGRQSETKSLGTLGRSLALSSGGVTVDTTKETGGTACGEAGNRVRFVFFSRFPLLPTLSILLPADAFSFTSLPYHRCRPAPASVPDILEEEQPERFRVEAREQGERRADLLRAAGVGEIIGGASSIFLQGAAGVGSLFKSERNAQVRKTRPRV